MYWFSAVSFAALLAFNAPGQAAALTPEKATELLAKAWMVDNRCDVLGKDDRDELTQFVARAEISVAEKISVKAAQNAIAQGRELGKTMTCDTTSANMVKDVLAAARSADGPSDDSTKQQAASVNETVSSKPAKIAALSEEPLSVADPIAEEPEPSVEKPFVTKNLLRPANALKVEKKTIRKIVPKKPEREVIRGAKLNPKSVEKPKAGKALNTGYASTAENYYKELRCRRVSQRTINAMYAKVLREHKQAVSANGKNAVRALLRAAENRAANRSC